MHNCDFLVIGTGIAGLSFALDASEFGHVVLVCKKNPEDTNTSYAQGGIASVVSDKDTFVSHVKDTLVAGAGLCNEEIVRLVVSSGPERIKQLLNWGAQFDRDLESKQFELAQEGGHSARRILHSRDSTGREIERALLARVQANPKITLLSHMIAIDLIVSEETHGSKRQVFGAYLVDEQTGEVTTWGSRITVLATGGAGKVYLYTSNSDSATGDGIAMAYRAGANIGNMEFIQFHPTCLYHLRAKSFLLSEALRGEGAILLNQAGERFMETYHPLKELAPRDIVARAIDSEMKRTGSSFVLLDISHKDSQFVRNRFPSIVETTSKFGFDMTKEAIPVVPAAHYTCGGIVADRRGRTSINNLYAIGECACTGLHGANRLASNSLLEAAVFAHEAALDAGALLSSVPAIGRLPEWDHLNTAENSERVLVSHNWDEVRRTMWNLVGIVRNDLRLELASKRLEAIKEETRKYYWHYRITPDLIELRNIIQVAEIIIESALSRRESRGLHWNVDCPETDDVNWHHDTIVSGTRRSLY